MVSIQNNSEFIISHNQAISIVNASVPECYAQNNNSSETFPPVSYEQQYAPFADTIKKLESIVHMEKDKEIYHLQGLLQQKTKQLEDYERMISNLNKYLSHSHGELGKIFGSLKALTPFTKKGTTVCFGPLKNEGVKKTLVQLLGKLSTQFSSNQENLRETMLLLEKGSSILKECQHQVEMEKHKRAGRIEKKRKSPEIPLPPAWFFTSLSLPLPFSCPVCQAQFDQQNKVMMHLRLIHNFELKNVSNRYWNGQKLVYRPQHGWDFKCTKCTEAFALAEHLEIHDKEAHSVIQYDNEQNSM